MSLKSKFWSFFEYIAKRQSFDDFSKFWPFLDLDVLSPRTGSGEVRVGPGARSRDALTRAQN